MPKLSCPSLSPWRVFALMILAGLEPARETLFTVTFSLYAVAGLTGTLLAMGARRTHAAVEGCPLQRL